MSEIEWTRAGILAWMRDEMVMERKTAQDRDRVYTYFIDQANKLENMDDKGRKLYRLALPLVQGSTNPKKITKFMEFEE